jgi:hypothetical protein
VIDAAEIQYGPNSPQVLAVIYQADQLTPDQLAALDAAEASMHEELGAAWAALRQASSPEWRSLRSAAGNDAWDAVAAAAQRAGITVPLAQREGDPDDWDSTTNAGFGAARAAQAVAGAIVAPPSTQPDVVITLSRPWGEIVGHSSLRGRPDEFPPLPLSANHTSTIRLLDLLVGNTNHIRKAAWLAPIGSEAELAAAMRAAGHERTLLVIEHRIRAEWPPPSSISLGEQFAQEELAARRLTKRAVFIEACLRVLNLQRAEDLNAGV